MLPAFRLAGGYGAFTDVQEIPMLRKLIMLAITSGLAKKLYDNYRRKQMRTPFPTSGRPMEGRHKRTVY
jgi:hypothetical protein